MYDWLNRHANFLLQHEIGHRAQQRANNIGSYYYVCLASHLVALNRTAEAQRMLGDFFNLNPKGLPGKVGTDGQLIHELSRTRPFHYTAFELQALTYLADLLQSITPADARDNPYNACQQGLKRSLDFAIKLGTGQVKEKLPKPLEKDVDMRQLVFPMLSASKHDDCYKQWLSNGDMEKPDIDTLRGWNVRGRLLWALKQRR